MDFSSGLFPDSDLNTDRYLKVSSIKMLPKPQLSLLFREEMAAYFSLINVFNLPFEKNYF